MAPRGGRLSTARARSFGSTSGARKGSGMLIEYVGVNVRDILSEAVSDVVSAVGNLADFALHHKLVAALLALAVLLLLRWK